MVLEPLSWRHVRHRVLRLHAALRGPGLRAEREVRAPAGDLPPLPADREDLRALRERLLWSAGHEHAVGRGRGHVDGAHQLRRLLPRALRGHQLWGPYGCAAARDPGSRQLPGPHVPHVPLGLRLHGRLLRGRPGPARGQARGHRWHRSHGRAGDTPPWRGRRAAVRLPAHAIVGRHARQPRNDRGVRAPVSLQARLAEGAPGKLLLHDHDVEGCEGGPRQRWLDGHHQEHPGEVHHNIQTGAEGGRRQERTAHGRHHQGRPPCEPPGPVPADGEDTQARGDRCQGPGDGRGPEAVVRPVLQAAGLPRRLPGDLQPAQRHARAHRGPGRRCHHAPGHRCQRR
mmetsp:Transcript_57690/g.163852  ORF Transcript_57690/g.163852 Transcript_57690/m.163852 type:complete len:342 (+) Transcript_57690:429-1454(+)